MSSRESEARPVSDCAAAPFPWLLAAAAVALGATALITTLWLMPRMGEEELGRLHLPRSWSDVQALRNVLDSYAQAHLAATLACFLMIYILLQGFSIPGSTFLNVLGGALFGLPTAFAFCTMGGTVGASLAYLVSMAVGTQAARLLPQARLEQMRGHVVAQKGHLFSYLLFLRITPFLPNWFINLACPVLGVGYMPFFFATLFGIMPQTFLTVEAGLALYDLTDESGGVIDMYTWLLLAAFGSLALLPTMPPVRRLVTRVLGMEAVANEEAFAKKAHKE